MPIKFALLWGRGYMYLPLRMERERWPISKHDQLRELCVLAAAGDVPACEADSLRLHLDDCESCRSLFTELRDVHAIQLAHVPSLATHPDSERESRIKDSILRAARGESLRLSDPPKSDVEYAKPEIKLIGAIRGIRGWSIGASLCILAACLALAFALRPTPGLNGHGPAATPQVATTPIPRNSDGHVRETPNRDEELLRGKVASLEADRSRLAHGLLENQEQNSKLHNRNADGPQQPAARAKA